MIQFEKFTLPNGLRVIVHEDYTTPMAVLNVLYDVGSRDENPDKTGFAHLFEHLMFGGSIHIPNYDEALQIAGGENNAYTTSDFTDYYIQLPAENIETAFWLESDRMLSLDFNERSLDVQRKVVSEEFKEHYINKPYGDVWQIMREMAYKEHPYRWLTIGKELSHIENAQLQDVKDFFFTHYTPANAIVAVAGNVTLNQIKQLAEKWFGDIPSGKKFDRHLPKEPLQQTAQKKSVERDVPLDALYKSYHIYPRMDQRYYVADLICQLLSDGHSSRLYQSLVKEKKFFSNIECYHFGTIDAGLLTVEGKLVKGTNMEEAEKALNEELQKLKNEKVAERELQKVRNKVDSMIAFEDMTILNRANNLAFYELLGNAAWMNEEMDHYEQVTSEDILTEAQHIFSADNSNTLYYFSKQP